MIDLKSMPGLTGNKLSMATIIRCIRDAGTNEPVYVNVDSVRYFDANVSNHHVTFHFAKGESLTVGERLEG